MKYKTYVCGTIDISGLPKLNKMEIRNYLESIYTIQDMVNIFSEDEVVIDDEWESYEETEKFMITMYKVSKLLNKDTSSLIMCNGDREGDIWGIIIKNNKLYSQRFELKPEGEAKEYTA